MTTSGHTFGLVVMRSAFPRPQPFREGRSAALRLIDTGLCGCSRLAWQGIYMENGTWILAHHTPPKTKSLFIDAFGNIGKFLGALISTKARHSALRQHYIAGRK